MKRILICSVFFVLCSLAAHAQCQSCGNDPSTGGLTCDSSDFSGGCKCGIHYLGHGLWSCVQCGICGFAGCAIPCNPSNCDPTIDPTCGPTTQVGTVAKTASLISSRVALQSPKMAGVLTALALANACQVTRGKLRDENTKTQNDWVMFTVSNGWVIQLGSETLGVLPDHWFLTRQDLPVITERIVQ